MCVCVCVCVSNTSPPLPPPFPQGKPTAYPPSSPAGDGAPAPAPAPGKLSWRPQIDLGALPIGARSLRGTAAGSLGASASLSSLGSTGGFGATGAGAAAGAGASRRKGDARRLLPEVTPYKSPAPGGVRVDPVASSTNIRAGLGAPLGVLRPNERSVPAASRAQLACVKDLLKRTHYAVSDAGFYTPSDRIGSNLTPTAKALTMKTITTGAKPPSASGGPRSAPNSPSPIAGSASTGSLGASMRSSGSRSVLTAFPKPVATMPVSPLKPSGAKSQSLFFESSLSRPRRSSLTNLRPDDPDSDDDDDAPVRACVVGLRVFCVFFLCCFATLPP